MKLTKEFLSTIAFALSISFLLCTHNEINATENEIKPATAVSYNKEIELDFVDIPEKRTREQALKKMKELSRWYPALHFVYENDAILDRKIVHEIMETLKNAGIKKIIYF